MLLTRVFADANGESHYEDSEITFKSVDFAPPAPALGLSPPTRSKNYAFLKAPVGWIGDWHPAPARMIFFYLAGEIEAEVSDGEIRRFGPGSATLVEDTFGRGHKSRVVGDTEVVAAIVQLDD